MTSSMFRPEPGPDALSVSYSSPSPIPHTTVRPVRPMNADELCDLLAHGTSDSARGLLQAASRFNLGGHARRDGAHDQDQLVQMMDEEVRRHTDEVRGKVGTRPEHPLAAPVQQRTRVEFDGSGRRQQVPVVRDLNVADIEWLKTLGNDPDKVTTDDFAALRELQATTAAKSSDRRLVDAAVAPLRDRLDLAAARHDLEALDQRGSGTYGQAVVNAAVEAVARALRTELGEDFTDDEIRARAVEKVTEVQHRADNAAFERRAEQASRVSELEQRCR